MNAKQKPREWQEWDQVSVVDPQTNSYEIAVVKKVFTNTVLVEFEDERKIMYPKKSLILEVGADEV